MAVEKRILFNDLILFRSNTGIASVAKQFLRAFPQVETEIKIDLLSDLLLARPFTRQQKKVSQVSKEGSFLKGILSEWLYFYARAILNPIHKPKIFHDPDLLALPLGQKKIATIHDLSVLLFPEWHPAHRVQAYKKYFKNITHSVDHFLSVSETSKRDFIRMTGIAPEKVTVVLNAPNPVYQPLNEEKKKQNREKWCDGKEYFLFVSTLEPRKNVLGLLSAWEKMPASFHKQYHLLLVGGYGWKSMDLARKLADPRLTKSVKWLGSLDTDDLVECVGAASALVYPSFYEGFGLPPIEAMACGVPVICSDRGALKETVGDAAWIIEPEKTESLQEAMSEILKSSLQWQQKGFAQAKKYSWNSFAKTVAGVYRRLLSE